MPYVARGKRVYRPDRIGRHPRLDPAFPPKKTFGTEGNADGAGAAAGKFRQGGARVTYARREYQPGSREYRVRRASGQVEQDLRRANVAVEHGGPSVGAGRIEDRPGPRRPPDIGQHSSERADSIKR